MKLIAPWRLKTGTLESRKLAMEFCLDAGDVAGMFGVTRDVVYLWAKRGRYGFLLPCQRITHRQRSSVTFRLPDVQEFAWKQNLKLDPSTLHPVLLARWGLIFDDATSEVIASHAKVAE